MWAVVAEALLWFE